MLFRKSCIWKAGPGILHECVYLYDRLQQVLALEDRTGSMALRARKMVWFLWKVRFARERIMPGSTTVACTSGPALLVTFKETMPPSTTMRSFFCNSRKV